MQREKELKRQLDDLVARIGQLEKGIQNALIQVKMYGHSWTRQLEHASKADFKPTKDYGKIVAFMDQLEENQIWDFPFVQTAKELESLQRELHEYKAELNNRGNQIRKNKEELEATIQNLEKGIKPFPEQVSALKRLLEEELFAAHKKTVDVFVLADLLEIRDQTWPNAIEGYLDKQKF